MALSMGIGAACDSLEFSAQLITIHRARTAELCFLERAAFEASEEALDSLPHEHPARGRQGSGGPHPEEPLG